MAPRRLSVAAVALLALALANPLRARENSTELYRKAAALAVAGDIDQSIPVFQKTIKVNPSYCLAHYGLGKAYLNKPVMIDQAIIHLRKASQLDRRFVRAHFYLGMACMLRKHYREAAAAFRQAYELDDTFIEALFNLGALYEIMGNTYKSDFYFRKYLQEKKKEQEEIDI